MNTRLLSIILICCAAASTAWAGQPQITLINDNAWGQQAFDHYGGGPFEVQPFNLGLVIGKGRYGATQISYISFCMELNEPIGQSTYNAVVSDAADFGGIGGGSPDPLDPRSAYLYTQFIHGTLPAKLAAFSGDKFTYGEGESGIAMQQALWVIEEELLPGDVTSQMAINLISMADAAILPGGEWFDRGIGNVRILNLTDIATGINKQDLIIMVFPVIPDRRTLSK